MASVEGPLQSDWQLEGPREINFLRDQLAKGCHFPPAVYEAVSGQIIAILAGKFGVGPSQKPPTKRMVFAIAKLLDQMRRTDITAYQAITNKMQAVPTTVHVHQGTEVHVQGSAAIVCPPELAAKLQGLPDDVLEAIAQADNVVEEGDSPDVPGSDPAAD